MDKLCALMQCDEEAVVELPVAMAVGGGGQLPVCAKHKAEIEGPGMPTINLRPVMLELYGGRDKTARLRVEDGRLIREEDDHGSKEKEA